MANTKTFYDWLLNMRVKISQKCYHCNNYKHGKVFDKKKCVKCNKEERG